MHKGQKRTPEAPDHGMGGLGRVQGGGNELNGQQYF